MSESISSSIYESVEQLPFTIVDRSDRKSPLQQHNPTKCKHRRAYATDKKWAPGTHWVCADCGHCSKFPRDL